MKKFLALLLAVLMVLSMAAMVACSDDPATPPANDETPDQQPGTDEPGTEEPGTDEPGTDEPGIDPDVQKKLDAVIERINKIEELTKDNYTKFKSKISNARTYYDKLTDEQKALIPEELIQKLIDAEAKYEALKAADEKAEALTINKLICSSPVVDGLMNVEYFLGASLSASSEAGTKVTFRFLLDNDYLYIIEERKDATPVKAGDFNAAETGDSSVLYLTKDGELLATLYWHAATAKSADPVIADENGVKDWSSKVVYANDGNSYIFEAAIKLSDLGLTKENFEKELIGFTFTAYDADGSAVTEMKQLDIVGWDDCQRFLTAKPVLVNMMANGTPVIDGRLDDLYMQSNYIELSQSACDEFSEEQIAAGAGIVGAPDLATPDFELMHSTFRFAIDDEYLYVAEHRYDLVPIYQTLSFKEPYKADGTLLWFTTNGNGQPTVGIDWNRATMDSNKPVLGLFFNNDQKSAVKKDWECVVKNCGSEYEYIMEAKIPLADLNLTKADFEAAKVSFTYCTVDIINPQYDPANFNWANNGYQLQYIGVNNWDKAPVLMVNPSNTEVGYLPIVDPYDPEFDLEDSEMAEKPFDTVPFDPDTGYLTTEYRYAQYQLWFSDMKSEEYVFTKDPADVFEGTVVNTASWNSGVGHYTDGDRQYVIKIDMNKYKNAIIVLELAQNYDVRVSADASIETMDPSELYEFDGWTKVQDYVDVHGERTTSGSLHHAIAIESSTFVDEVDYLYIRIGNCGNKDGHGGSCYNFSIFYTED